MNLRAGSLAAFRFRQQSAVPDPGACMLANHGMVAGSMSKAPPSSLAIARLDFPAFPSTLGGGGEKN